VILVRHGQSEWNAVYNRTRVDPNIPDPPLTAEGRRQAEAAAQHLARFEIERLLVSPYIRTLETAEIIAARTGIAIAVEPMVRERAAFSCDIGTPRSRLASWMVAHLSFDHVEEIWWQSTLETEAELATAAGASAPRPKGWQTGSGSPWSPIGASYAASRKVEARNGELVRFDPHALPGGPAGD
jgi:broad specificity phosphatase PhoE